MNPLFQASEICCKKPSSSIGDIMAVWRIGFDESGSFNHLNENDNSYVCAVVTRKKNTELNKIFANVYQKQRLGSIKNIAKSDFVLAKFHGSEQGARRKTILKSLLEADDDLFTRIIKSKGRPYVTVNPQQWWTAALLGIVEKFFSPDKEQTVSIKKGDTIDIEIANRDEKCLGLLGAINSPEIWNSYNNALATSIENILQKKHKKFTIKVKLCAAGKHPLPTLADQVANMVKSEFQSSIRTEERKLFNLVKNPENASPSNFVLGKDIDSYLDNGDRLGAVEIILSQIFSGEYENLKKLGDILKHTDSTSNNFKIWSLIINTIETTLLNRGADGNAINHVEKIMNVLTDKCLETINDPLLLRRFWKAYVNYVGDAGHSHDSLGVFSKIKEHLQNHSFTFNSKYEKWAFYVNVLAAKAELQFNAYDFDVHDLDNVLKTQDKINNVKFPSDFLNKNQIDDVKSLYYGTVGQREAFLGNLNQAIPYIKSDYEYSSNYYKGMAASFLVVIYHKQKNLNDAQKWLEIQRSHIKNENDQWLVLNELRIRALELELDPKKANSIGRENNIHFWHNEGDYPWPLLLKWRAFINYKKGDPKNAGENLSQACKNLAESSGFTIRTLALSVLAMLIVINKETANNEAMENHQNEYVQLLNKCCNEVQIFKNYVNSHPEFDEAKTGGISLWEAATLLPFNYS